MLIVQEVDVILFGDAPGGLLDMAVQEANNLFPSTGKSCCDVYAPVEGASVIFYQQGV